MLQYDGTANPRDFEMGVRQQRLSATMGVASGTLTIDPATYQRAHADKSSTFSRGGPHVSSLFRGTSSQDTLKDNPKGVFPRTGTLILTAVHRPRHKMGQDGP